MQPEIIIPNHICKYKETKLNEYPYKPFNINKQTVNDRHFELPSDVTEFCINLPYCTVLYTAECYCQTVNLTDSKIFACVQVCFNSFTYQRGMESQSYGMLKNSVK